ncbi:MAG TPA: DJ-1/PfpI family protein [Candidatus Gastranaerophilales bacterium]|nr:DJ-1/PfpI family protein [Candidatus Gastranaerophilales bacterium]
MDDILIILADGFEEAEAVITIDVLRRMNFKVCIASLNQNLETTSSHKIKIIADKKLTDCKNDKFKAVVLPGGMPGASNLKNSKDVIDVIKKTYAEGGFVCAICAAPIVLSHAGILDNIKFTAYPGFDEFFKTPPLLDMVVKDKNVITGKGPGAAFDFARAIAHALGKDSSQVAKGMLLE